MEPGIVVALIGAGFACGVVNALAGGGSFITFPLLLLIGLPPQVANATNRIAIIVQCIAGAATYKKLGVLPTRAIPALLIPSVAGAILGSILAFRLDENAFRQVSAVLLALAALTVFIDTKKWTVERPEGGHVSWKLHPLLFVLAVYGGFLQIGLGTLLLAFFVLGGGYDVIRGNALKFGLVPVYQTIALVIFARAGQVDWLVGITLAVGNMLGGIVGAHLVVRKGTKWVRIVVLISAIGAILKLSLDR